MEADNVTPIKGRATPEKLKMVESHKLVTLILAEFTEKKMTYKQFAEYATPKLGFVVTGAQVQTRVQEFEVPHGVQEPQDPSAYTAMLLKHEVQIGELIEQMAKLTAWVNDTFPTAKGKMFK